MKIKKAICVICIIITLAIFNQAVCYAEDHDFINLLSDGFSKSGLSWLIEDTNTVHTKERDAKDYCVELDASKSAASIQRGVIACKENYIIEFDVYAPPKGDLKIYVGDLSLYKSEILKIDEASIYSAGQKICGASNLKWHTISLCAFNDGLMDLYVDGINVANKVKSTLPNSIHSIKYTAESGIWNIDSVRIYQSDKILDSYLFMDTFQKINHRLKDSIALFANSPYVYFNDKKIAIDENVSVKPYIKNSEIMLPVGVISKMLGANVEWDDQSQLAKIILNDIAIRISIESNEIYVNDRKIENSVLSEIVEDRIYISGTALAEAFGKKIYFDTRGFVIINDNGNPFILPDEFDLVNYVIKDISGVEYVLDNILSKAVFTELSGNSGGIPIKSVASLSDDGNKATNLFDGDHTTRWSAAGYGQWACCNLGTETTVSGVSIAWYGGSKRQAIFSIEVSIDGINWKTVFSGMSSGTSDDYEDFPFDSVKCKYIRYMGYMNSTSEWNSVADFIVK